jgi:hypothetical protein
MTYGRRVRHRIPEGMLRRIWMRQHFTTTNLSTTDGRRVTIHSPGEPNPRSGPDFLGARISIGDIVYSGGVEFHWEAGRRRARGPRLRDGVILHVVFDRASPCTCAEAGPPPRAAVLDLSPHVPCLRVSSAGKNGDQLPAHLRCSPWNEHVSSSFARAWLEKLAAERKETSIRRYEARLNELARETVRSVHDGALPAPGVVYPGKEGSHGGFGADALWEQLLYEGVMEVLGHPQNRAAFQRLAQNARLDFLLAPPDDTDGPRDELALRAEAILFNVAALLPSGESGMDAESTERLRSLANLWENVRPRYRRELLRPAEWRCRLRRSEDHPTLLLAGAARLAAGFFRQGGFRTIVEGVTSPEFGVDQRWKCLGNLFVVPADDYWSSHRRLGSRSRRLITALIGRGRAREIVLNAVVPLLLLYARTFRHRLLHDRTELLLSVSPPPGDNGVLSLCRRELRPGGKPLGEECSDHGVMELFNRYCVQGRCPECAIGKAVFSDDFVRE